MSAKAKPVPVTPPPSAAEIDAMWLSTLPRPPQPLSGQTEESIYDFLWRCTRAADSAAAEGKTLGLGPIDALDWVRRPTNWPFGPFMRSRTDHVYGTLRRKLDEEAVRRREREGVERSERVAT